MKLKIIFISVLFCQVLSAQNKGREISGQVSFISSQNVYVKFSSTNGISSGDTLFFSENGKRLPVFVVSGLSSISCVCRTISDLTFSVGDQVSALVSGQGQEITGEQAAPVTEPAEKIPEPVAGKQDSVKTKSGKVKGSISVNSYSDFSNTSADNTNRFRYTLSLDAENIGGSKFSADTYISFKHTSGDWSEVKSDLFSALKIYSLSLRYDPGVSTSVTLGRNINRWMSSVGAIDGLQAEKRIKGFTFGAVAGFRPDYADYGLDTRLFQYGAYAAFSPMNKNNASETSVGFMQQTNDFKTDRRFLYFQHSNNIVKNLSLFSTFEVDLYKLNIDSLNRETKQSVFDLTSLYLSLRYKVFRNLSVYGSYDARKNVMYYETYKTFIDRILETELRQGFRLQANYRITNSISTGLQAGYRFLKSDPHPSRNLYGFINYNNIPGVSINATLSGTLIESSYLNGKVAAIDLYRDFAGGKFEVGLGYSYVDYRLPENFLNLIQHIGEANMSWTPGKNISLSAYYEGQFEKTEVYHRIYIQVRKRF